MRHTSSPRVLLRRIPNSSMRSIALQADVAVLNHASAVDIYRTTCYIPDGRSGLGAELEAGRSVSLYFRFAGRRNTGMGDNHAQRRSRDGKRPEGCHLHSRRWSSGCAGRYGRRSAHKGPQSPGQSRSESVEITGRRGKPEMILTGPVASVSPASGFFVMRHGAGRNAEEIPVEVDDRTTLTRGGSRVGLDQLRVGDRVRINYSGSPGDVTKTVEVMGGPGTRAGRSTGMGSGRRS
jgi:hypothetical protein